MNNTVRVALATYEKLLADQQRLAEISTEAWGRELPTKRLADLISGDETALLRPATPPGTSGDAAVDAERQRIATRHEQLEAALGELVTVRDAQWAWFQTLAVSEIPDLAADPFIERTAAAWDRARALLAQREDRP